ncbi:hypothetical protein ACFRKE_17705 [Kitasatospora indigofera]|uniref:hypothetical protein n=1 Tax=Kitasatospora indigofera TaxID=67307 RepID=UPI00369B67A3
MTTDGRRIPPLLAGRHPAGLALFGWLDDARAPRLCRVSGPPGVGKSHLLDWLATGCTRPETPAARRIRAVLPADGHSLSSAVWSLGVRLGLSARTAQELTAALAEDGRPTVICVPGLNRAADPAALVAGLLRPLLELPQVRLVVEAVTGSPGAAAFGPGPAPAVMELDDPQWTDRERFGAWCLGHGGDPGAYPNPAAALGRSELPRPAALGELAARIPVRPDGTPDLLRTEQDLLSEFWTAAAREGGAGRMQADPLLLVLAGPVAVTAALEGEDGTVVRAWWAAGPALVEQADPAQRAATLRARLLGVDEAAVARLSAVPAAWAGAWALWPSAGDAWPGPVTALAAGLGAYAGQVLLAGPTGAVRTVDAATGRPGSLLVPGPRPLRALAATPGGTVVLLDAGGRTELLAPPRPGPGLDPYALGGALDRLRAAAAGELSTLAAVPGLSGAAPAVGDVAGGVCWDEDGEVRREQLHQGPVTALAGAAVDGDGVSDEGFPLLVSGGFDGVVRLWGPRSEPMPGPLDRREGPVTAVAAGIGAAGPVVAAAWEDGLVRVRWPDDPDGVLDLRLGSPVWSLALAGGLLVIGGPEGPVAVRLGAG